MSENEKKAAAAEATEVKHQSRKSAAAKTAEAPVPEDTELLAKQKEEKLNALIEKGKKAGKLTSKELMDVLDDMNLEPEELDKFYDKLENLGIDTSGEDILPPLDDEALPALEELQEIEEVTSIFWRLGSVLLILPVAVIVWLNVLCILPSTIYSASPSAYVDFNLASVLYSSILSTIG